MLPIALASGTASEWKNGLVWALMGCLISSMFLTVFLVPVVYYAVHAVKERFTKRKGVEGELFSWFLNLDLGVPPAQMQPGSG